MTDSADLNTTENISKRLEIEYHNCSREIHDSVINCLAYKTTEHRPENRKPSICPQWEHFHSVIELKESLNYRVGSLIWHCRQFPRHQKEFAETISELKIKRKDHHSETRDAYYTASYILDDIVFCSVSVFDYLAQLIYKINHPEKKGKKYWNELAKHRDYEDPKLAELIKKTHYDYVHSLSRLRGRSIHTQADIGGLQVDETYNSKGITHTFDFLMPEEALRFLPFFSEDKRFSIEPGAYLIALHTLVSVRDILVQLGCYKYTCVYDPLKKSENN